MFDGVMINPVEFDVFTISCRAFFIGSFRDGKCLSCSFLCPLYLNDMLNQAGLYE